MRGTYDPGFVLLSLMVAGLASYTALSLASRIAAQQATAARHAWLTGGALSLGVGIWSMHFVGMLAFSLPIPMGYDFGITILSLVAAVVASYLALYVSTRDRLSLPRLLCAGLLMGAGISVMHYTGMAAMRMFPAIQYDYALFGTSLAIAVGASVAALWIAHTLRREGQRHLLAKRLAASGVMALAIAGMHYTGMAAATFAPGSVCLAASEIDGTWLGLAVTLCTLLVLLGTLALNLQERRLEQSQVELVGSIKRLNNALVRLETVDPLTELPNRATLVESLELALTRARRKDESLAVLFMDLDGFKTVNDSLGHSAGDALLQAFAQRLRQVVRKRDLVARLGGDEFVVVLEGLKAPADAGRVAMAVLTAMQHNLVVADSTLMVTPSIGIAIFPRDADSVEGLLRNADIAMYAAKQAGRNTYRQYEASMGEQAVRLMQIQQGLQDALALGEMSLAFQPKFTGPTRQLTGAEALIRWNHRTLGPVPPDEFIPVAERSGLILEIGHWVVREVCRHLKLWQETGLPTVKVAINLSPKQLQQPDIAQELTTLVRYGGVDPSLILFEITEAVAMQDADRTARIIHAMHEQGFGVAIDDFGTGYSSLAYLQQFRVQQIKIDRFFTHGLDTHGEEGQAIVSAIVALAHSLNMEVVAEGVETSSQARKLRGLSCDQMQGFLLARPLTSEQFRNFLRDSRSQDNGDDDRAEPTSGLGPLNPAPA